MNENAQAIAFANNRARLMADLLESAYVAAKKLVGEWNAQNVSAVIPNDSTVIDDNASHDGRPLCKDSDVNNIVTRCQDYITWYEGGSSPTVSGGGTMGVANTVRAIEVNGRSPF
jgi:hypothetical protein